MEKELSDIELAWLEIEQLQQNFEMLTNEELISCRVCCLKRINRALDLLGSHVRDDMSECEV